MPMLQRSKDAAFGLGVTLVPIAVLAGAQFLFAHYTVTAVHHADPTIEALIISSFRRGVVNFYAIVALIIATYWLLAATLGRGRFLRIKSANVTLTLSVLSFALAMAVASTNLRVDRLFKVFCPVLGLPDEYPFPVSPDGQQFSFVDGPTPCEAFANNAAPIVLLGLPITLLAASVILRISVSRRRYGEGDGGVSLN